ncbi:glycoside hydrolase family 19 protein [Massilia rhizosphaerae]|uniref:glycoside hydrolase family 19 protein n=1 Tax=Massilia rhizosphaerae TaxID=2784389 RepID=UPI0018DE2982|nr:glycoside hydrolase family 19 protein [Massilia rhizosphaerae]
MNLVTANDLKRILPLAGTRADTFCAPLNIAMGEFEINTPARQAAFIAQIAHESGQFRYVRELASGAAYEGRIDLGNTMKGDGVRFRGRGLIQITGRTNYKACGAALGLDLILYPELLEQPMYACRSAGWFWKTHGLNELADAGDQVKITRRINGGTNGLAERLAYFEIAKKVLS